MKAILFLTLLFSTHVYGLEIDCDSLSVPDAESEIVRNPGSVQPFPKASGYVTNPSEFFKSIRSSTNKYIKDNCPNIKSYAGKRDFLKQMATSCMSSCRSTAGIKGSPDKLSQAFCIPICNAYFYKVDGIFKGFEIGLKDAHFQCKMVCPNFVPLPDGGAGLSAK